MTPFNDLRDRVLAVLVDEEPIRAMMVLKAAVEELYRREEAEAGLEPGALGEALRQ